MGIYDAYRLWYHMDGAYVWPANARVNQLAVAEVLRQMQAVIPLGGIGDFEVFCLDYAIWAGSYPDDGQASAKTCMDYIALAAEPSMPLFDLISHELCHALAAALIDAGELAGLRSILGDDYGTNEDDGWRDRPSERLAEYLSAALWGVDRAPVTERMRQLSPETLAKVREWGLSAIGKHDPAQIEVDGMTVIKMQVGNHSYTVNGETRTMDAAPVQLEGERTFVPVRFVAEALGAKVGWDEATRTVTISR